MRIKHVECEVKNIPLKTPFITALRRVENVEFVRIVIRSDDWTFSIGEAPATKAITGEDIEIILNSIESVKDMFIGCTAKEAIDILHSVCKIGSSAKAALDMAFLTLMAKEEDKTLYEYLGAKSVETLRTDVTISLKDSDAMLEDSRTALKNGLNILKVKLGSDVTHAVETIKNISHELPEAKIIVDANQAWSLEDSLIFVEKTKNIKIELIEQPVVANDLDGLKTITDISNIPILADESAFSLVDVKKVVETKSADMINIKLMKCGGLTKAVEILEYCRKMDVKCMLGSMLEGPYSINAALHLALAYTDVIKYIDLDSPLLYKEPSDELEFSFNGCEIRLI